jgi:leader peptidase (prepilin peptidase)/N-methyltransferase
LELNLSLSQPAILGASAILGALVGFLVHRWLWSRVPRLTQASKPGPFVQLGVAAATALLVVCAMVGAGATLSGLAYAFFGIAAVQLSTIDWRLRILPNVLVLPSSLLGLALLCLAAAVESRWDDLVRALAGAAVLFLVYLALALVSPTGMGMGDVKLAALVGLFLGYQGWTSLLVGAAAGFFIGALAGVALLLARRANLKSAVPFGPSMLGGAVIVLILGSGAVIH